MIKLITKVYRIINNRIASRNERKLFNSDLERGIKLRYKRIFGLDLNLEQPKTFAEKINWLKLNDRNPKIIKYADKYIVREFVKECVGEKYLVPMIGCWNNASEINFDLLPNSFVLKPNNSSGRVFICKDKKQLNVKKVIRILKKWEKENLTKETGEWFYEKIPFKIICEKFLQDNITDYKLYYANGKFIATQLILDRNIGEKSFLYVDKNWDKMEIKRKNVPSPIYIPKRPDNYHEMINIADKLAMGFIFCRVDLYNVGNKIYFGELSFYPNNGFVCYETDQMDEIFSKQIDVFRDRK